MNPRVRNREEPRKPNADEFRTLFKHFMQSELEYISEHCIIHSVNRFFYAFKNAMSSRVFFFTKSGLISLAPLVVKENDLLCIYFGGKSPFLIREIEKAFSSLKCCTNLWIYLK
jgi:hypothetical protein